MKTILQKLMCIAVTAMACMSIYAQTTTTFTYTATEKIARFEDEGFKTLFVGATAIASHTYDAGTKAGTVVYEGEVTALGNNALQFQSDLTSIVIPEGVTSIGYKAFYQCTNLTTIKLPKSLKLIGDVSGLTFDGCIGLANGKFIIDDIAWWCALDIKGCYSNPIYYAKHIYSDEDTEITDLVIPEGVTSIGHDAFYHCEGITSISFPSTLESIGDNAFNSCTNIASVTIPKDASIGESCFANCSGLTSVTIPEGVETIGASAFCKTGLTSLTLPSTIRSMSQSFYGCESLTELTLKDGITTLGGSFLSCTALASVNIPGSIKEVGYQDFSGCTGLTTVTLNEGTEDVTFNGCTNLENINFPSTIKEVTITNNEKLETVTLNEGMQEINSFNYCSALKQINIPSTVTYVGTFRDCSALEKVIVANIASWCAARHYDSRFYGPQKMAGKLYLGTPASHTEIINLVIPEGVTTIKGEAFFGLPNITTITLPSSLTMIEGKVFQGCTGVTDVYCFANSATMTWSESESNFKDGKATQMHVDDPITWITQFPDANVTFATDIMATKVGDAYWVTYYNSGYNFKADANTTVYKAAINGSTLTLTEIADKVITAGQAVILKSTGANITLALQADASAADYSDNVLEGVDEATAVAAGFKYYVLSNENSTLGFYRYAGATLGANKAFVKVVDAGAPAYFSFNFGGGTTSLREMRNEEGEMRNVYNLSGQRVTQPTKGLYIVNGKTVVIK